MRKNIIPKSRAQDQEWNGGKRASRTGLMNWDDSLDSQSTISIAAEGPTPEYNSKYPSEPGILTHGGQRMALRNPEKESPTQDWNLGSEYSPIQQQDHKAKARLSDQTQNGNPDLFNLSSSPRRSEAKNNNSPFSEVSRPQITFWPIGSIMSTKPYPKTSEKGLDFKTCHSSHKWERMMS
jgi:hypothetical protein